MTTQEQLSEQIRRRTAMVNTLVDTLGQGYGKVDTDDIEHIISFLSNQLPADKFVFWATKEVARRIK